MATPPRRTIAATVLAALLLAACGGGDGTADSAATPASVGETAGAEASAALLGIIEPGVDVADEPADAAAAAFRTGEDGEGLVVGDLVRTDDAGFAEVAWFDGALARVDAGTLYALAELDTTPGEAVVETDLEVGRIWNRLRTDVAETYEVRTDVGTAAVRGTAFWVRCDDGGCTFAVLEGTVAVTTTDGTVVVLEAGQQVTVAQDGIAGDVEPTDFDDAWVVRNAGLDEDAGFDAIEAASGTAVAGGCPLVEVPEGWVEEADPEAAGPAAEFCRYVRPGADLFEVIEWYAEDSEQFRILIEDNRPFHENFRDEVAASDCSDGMRDEFVEIEETSGQGELYSFSWRLVRGPLPESFDECISSTGNSFHGVVIDGQVFALRMVEGVPGVSVRCPTPGPSGSPEQDTTVWNAYIDCLFEESAEQRAAYRELAAVLLGG